MTPKQADAIAMKAGALILSAPAKRSALVKQSLVDRSLLDELAALLQAAGYNLILARARKREIEREGIASQGALAIFREPRYLETYCSHCGGTFGPGDHGFSHCDNHRGKAWTR